MNTLTNARLEELTRQGAEDNTPLCASSIEVCEMAQRLLAAEAQLAELPRLLADRAHKNVGWTEAHVQEARAEKAEAQLAELRGQEKEPVAYIIQDEDARARGEKGILRYFSGISSEDASEYEISITPLYARPAPPAASQPYTVPDETPSDVIIAEIEEEVRRGYRKHQTGIRGQMVTPLDSVEYWYMTVSWGKCRAAMLQLSEKPQSD